MANCSKVREGDIFEHQISHCKSEGLRKYFDQVYGTLQIALVHFFGNINKKA
jgi:hypothetical protein